MRSTKYTRIDDREKYWNQSAYGIETCILCGMVKFGETLDILCGSDVHCVRYKLRLGIKHAVRSSACRLLLLDDTSSPTTPVRS